MTMYGLFLRDHTKDDFVWFNTIRALGPGTYFLGRHHRLVRHQERLPNVYVAESIPALVLLIAPLIQQAEDQAQSSLSTPGISSKSQHRIETKMTDGLLQSLTETSSIWVSDPDWLDDLQPIPRNGT